MDKHVLLVFFLFCCFEAVTALKCITCYLHLMSDRCRRGFGVCVAQEQEECMTLKVYDYSTLEGRLSYMVCQKFCSDLTLHRHGRVFIYKCCNQDYCNFRFFQAAAETAELHALEPCSTPPLSPLVSATGGSALLD
ncbi:prostate and testis expressed protein 3 [Pteronotus mesoamericanus]|uniref:prostate and testis expressed protein 3 n=1 Tax=Pteronotus mesoamericanus TaxID=1884717 RepID=UPI0023EA8FBC|nr:prostate and testis expressed protein 3 [Pteronotus parnellii mesoamericanus]